MAFDTIKWETDHRYPEKIGICEVCQQKDTLKLAWDQVRWICLNSHACMLRWTKKVGKNGGS